MVALRPAALAFVVACGSPAQQPTVENRTGATSRVTADCDRLAERLAPIPGVADCCGGPAGRRRRLGEYCTDQRWGRAVVDCVTDPSNHDLLACMREPHLTPAQNAAWTVEFERMYGWGDESAPPEAENP